MKLTRPNLRVPLSYNDLLSIDRELIAKSIGKVCKSENCFHED